MRNYKALRRGLPAACVLSLAAFAFNAPARADAVSDYYAGKTFSIISGFTPNGEFDTYFRLLGRHLGKHIPGNPNAIVQNMPGAGSVTAVRYVDATAPKDGTVIGEFLPGIITQSIVTPDKVNVDFTGLAWVGVAKIGRAHV